MHPSGIAGESSLSMELCLTCRCLATTELDQTRQILFRRMQSSGMLCRMPLVITYVSEERIASIIKATRSGELETTLAVASKRASVASYC
jgi:hypothetical protein